MWPFVTHFLVQLYLKKKRFVQHLSLFIDFHVKVLKGWTLFVVKRGAVIQRWCDARLTPAAFSLSGRRSYKSIYPADEQNPAEILKQPKTSINITKTAHRSWLWCVGPSIRGSSSRCWKSAGSSQIWGLGLGKPNQTKISWREKKQKNTPINLLLLLVYQIM